MKLDSRKIQDFFSGSNLQKLTFSFLAKKKGWIFFGLFLLVFGLSVFIWYRYVYDLSWTEGERQKYIDSKEKGVIFDKKKFEEIVTKKSERKEEFERKIENREDFFRLNP